MVCFEEDVGPSPGNVCGRVRWKTIVSLLTCCSSHTRHRSMAVGADLPGVVDKAVPVHGHIAALGTSEGDVLGQERGDLVLEVVCQVMCLAGTVAGQIGHLYCTSTGHFN